MLFNIQFEYRNYRLLVFILWREICVSGEKKLDIKLSENVKLWNSPKNTSNMLYISFLTNTIHAMERIRLDSS